jgi:hypothetical protein
MSNPYFRVITAALAAPPIQAAAVNKTTSRNTARVLNGLDAGGA